MHGRIAARPRDLSVAGERKAAERVGGVRDRKLVDLAVTGTFRRRLVLVERLGAAGRPDRERDLAAAAGVEPEDLLDRLSAHLAASRHDRPQCVVRGVGGAGEPAGEQKNYEQPA